MIRNQDGKTFGQIKAESDWQLLKRALVVLGVFAGIASALYPFHANKWH